MRKRLIGKITPVLCALLMTALFPAAGAAEENGTGSGNTPGGGILNGMELATVSSDGFTVAYPAGGRQRGDEAAGLLVWSEYLDEERKFTFEGRLYRPDAMIPGGFAEDSERARNFFETSVRSGNDPNVADYERTVTEIDGHPALMERYEYHGNGTDAWSIGRIWYPRNNRILRISLTAVQDKQSAEEEQRKVTMADLETLALKTGYNEDEAPLSRKNAGITVSARGNPAEITAGRTIQFTAEFADKKQINWKSKNNGIAWSVVNAETGEPVAAAVISDKGKLTTDRKLSEALSLEIRATSEVFGTVGYYRLEVKPR